MNIPSEIRNRVVTLALVGSIWAIVTWCSKEADKILGSVDKWIELMIWNEDRLEKKVNHYCEKYWDENNEGFENIAAYYDKNKNTIHAIVSRLWDSTRNKILDRAPGAIEVCSKHLSPEQQEKINEEYPDLEAALKTPESNI